MESLISVEETSSRPARHSRTFLAFLFCAFRFSLVTDRSRQSSLASFFRGNVHEIFLSAETQRSRKRKEKSKERPRRVCVGACCREVAKSYKNNKNNTSRTRRSQMCIGVANTQQRWGSMLHTTALFSRRGECNTPVPYWVQDLARGVFGHTLHADFLFYVLVDQFLVTFSSARPIYGAS